MKILSLGAGVQSTTLLLMSCKGELPKLDGAIFSDTGWEPAEVYTHFDWLKTEAEKHGIPVHVVNNGNIKEDALRSQVRGAKTDEGGRLASMPYYTKEKESGREGMIRRQCTAEYKITPIERKLRELAGYKKRQRIPADTIEQWIGISTDEKQRARMSQKKWINFHYPLILDKKMSRLHCIEWLSRNYLGRVIPRSACIGCPFHSNDEWRRMKLEDPVSWKDAVEFDAAIRNMVGMRGKVYLHRECVPLDQVDLRNAEDFGQIGFSQECMGMCGV